jgi:hypothetical protein
VGEVHEDILHPIEASSNPKESLKVPQSGTFKLSFGFYVSAKRYVRWAIAIDLQAVFKVGYFCEN